jgi:hypothetical protein
MIAFLVFGTLAALALARCAEPGFKEVHSANHRYRLALDPKGSFKIMELGKAGVKVRARSKFAPLGHHYEPAMSNDGKFFVLVDRNAGLQVYRDSGQEMLSASPEDLLSDDELEKREGKWACHPEGQWLRQYRVNGRSIDLTLSGGRKRTVSW